MTSFLPVHVPYHVPVQAPPRARRPQSRAGRPTSDPSGIDTQHACRRARLNALTQVAAPPDKEEAHQAGASRICTCSQHTMPSPQFLVLKWQFQPLSRRRHALHEQNVVAHHFPLSATPDWTSQHDRGCRQIVGERPARKSSSQANGSHSSTSEATPEVGALCVAFLQPVHQPTSTVSAIHVSMESKRIHVPCRVPGNSVCICDGDYLIRIAN